MIEPYPFQSTILNLTRQSLREGYNSPLIVSPTGSGKTIMFSIIAHGAMKKGSRVLILVHREEILKQTLDKLYKLGVQPGQIAPGKPMTRDLIQVAMVGTLVRRLDKIQEPDIIMPDEGHHYLQHNTYGKPLRYFKDVTKIFWTATPERLDGTGLGINSGGFADCMIKGPSLNTLVQDGYLSYPFIKGPDKDLTKKFHITRGDIDKEEQEEYMTKKHIVGDAIEHYKQYLDGLPTIVSCVSIKHCYMMAEQYSTYARQTGKDWKAVVVQGGSKYKKERKDGLAGLETGGVQLVMFCDLINEGVDIPLVAGVQNLRRTLSLSFILQVWGRALRVVYGNGFDLSKRQGRLDAIANSVKPHAMILDHAGNHHLHGHVLDERQWSLDSIKRSKRKKAEPTTTSCPKCQGVWPGKIRKCPGWFPNGSMCGYIFSDEENQTKDMRKPPEVIAGQLIDALPGTDRETIKNLMGNIDIAKMTPSERQNFIWQLAMKSNDRKKIQSLATALGYKKGWTYQVWKMKGNR